MLSPMVTASAENKQSDISFILLIVDNNEKIWIEQKSEQNQKTQCFDFINSDIKYANSLLT